MIIFLTPYRHANNLENLPIFSEKLLRCRLSITLFKKQNNIKIHRCLSANSKDEKIRCSSYTNRSSPPEVLLGKSHFDMVVHL